MYFVMLNVGIILELLHSIYRTAKTDIRFTFLIRKVVASYIYRITRVIDAIDKMVIIRFQECL